MPYDRNLVMLLEEVFFDVYDLNLNEYNPENNRKYYNFAKCFCQQSDEQMQEVIQNAGLLHLDSMLKCFEFVKAEKNTYEANAAIDIDDNKLKICIDTCYATIEKHLAVNHNSESEDLLLRQVSQENVVQEGLLEIQIKKAALLEQKSELLRQQLEFLKQKSKLRGWLPTFSIQQLEFLRQKSELQDQILELPRQQSELQDQILELRRQKSELPKQQLEIQTKKSALQVRQSELRIKILEFLKQKSELLRQQLELPRQQSELRKQILKLRRQILKLRRQKPELPGQLLESQNQQLESQNQLSELQTQQENLKRQESLASSSLSESTWDLEFYEKIFCESSDVSEGSWKVNIKRWLRRSKVSFIDFLILINRAITPKDIFKYIDFLEPEYFELQKLIDFVSFARKCISNPDMLHSHLNSEEIQEKIVKFVDKITVKHILLMQHISDYKKYESNVLQKFIREAYTFKQLAVFWDKFNDDCLVNNNAFLQFENTSSVLSMFSDDLLDRIKNVENIDSIMNLLDTNPSIATTLLKKVNKNVLLKLHRHIFYAPEKEKPHCYEESAEKKFNEMVVGSIEANFAPERILKLIYDNNYYDFAFHLSYKTIVKILHMFNNPSEYINKIHNIEHILSDDNKHKLVLAFDRRFQNDTQCDKDQELLVVINSELQKYKSNKAQPEVDNAEIPKGEVGDVCNSIADKEKRENAPVFLNDVCSKLDMLVLMNPEDKEYKSNKIQPEVDNAEIPKGAAGDVCNSIADKEKRENVPVFLNDACSKLDMLVLMKPEDKEYKSNKIQLEVDSIEAPQGVDSIEIPQGAKGVVCNSGEVKENRKRAPAPLDNCVVSKFSKLSLAHNL